MSKCQRQFAFRDELDHPSGQRFAAIVSPQWLQCTFPIPFPLQNPCCRHTFPHQVADMVNPLATVVGTDHHLLAVGIHLFDTCRLDMQQKLSEDKTAVLSSCCKILNNKSNVTISFYKYYETRVSTVQN
jgi:hypothetical protein